MIALHTLQQLVSTGGVVRLWAIRARRSYAAKKARKGPAEQVVKFEITQSDDPTLLPGLAILKEGDPPRLQPDEAYPSWLWGLLAPLPTYAELRHKALSQGLESMTATELKRMILMYKSREKFKAEIQRKKHMIDQTVPESERPDWWPHWISKSNEHMDIHTPRKFRKIRKH